MVTLNDFTVQAADGAPVALEQYRGQVVLVVNVASACGFTPQYVGLERLQRQYGERGFTVLAFPCNQFGDQEPGSAEEIASFCELNYQTSFPIFAKVDVNGPDASPLWTWLKDARPGILGTTAIKWNFTKFLVTRDGVACKRFGSQTTPEEIEPEIVALLTGGS
ncbi:MAG: glutathione peroxidase [Gemmatimonadales bacterium]